MLRPKTVALGLAQDATDLVTNLTFIGKGPRDVDGEVKEVFLMRHTAVPDVLFSVRAPMRLVHQAPAAAPAVVAPIPPAAAAANVPVAAAPAVAPVAPVDARVWGEDEAGDEGMFDIDVDDDDANSESDGVPVANAAQLGAVGAVYQPWGHQPVNLVDDRATCRAALRGISTLLTPAAVFLALFPDSVVDRIIRSTNARDPTLNLVREEFFCWLGLLFLASRFTGRRQDLWVHSEDKYDPRPAMADAMSRRRFDAISSALRLTDTPAPAFRDPFHCVRELIADWNEHMEDVFRPSATVCLDESMVTYHNVNSPGHMFVPRKPNPNGNEYHTICDVETGIMFHVELVEGSSRPEQLGPPKYEVEHQSKTTALVLRMTETIRGSGRVVIMDSAFCVMKAIVALRQVGIYVATIAKKRRYWPKDIPGDEVIAFMRRKPVGELHGRRGMLNGMAFNLFAVNHVRYTFIMIATYGSTLLERIPKTIRTYDGQSITFYRNEPLSDYYRGRHAVDDHNHYRQGQRISLEKAWGSKFWPNRQLAFILSSNMVNAMLAYNHVRRAGDADQQLSFEDFTFLVAREFIRNWEERELAENMAAKRRRRAPMVDHRLVKLPVFEGATPGKRTSQPYQQVKCKGNGCQKMVRTYCSCDRLLALCLDCFSVHVAQADLDS
jgi:hypothetical protein